MRSVKVEHIQVVRRYEVAGYRSVDTVHVQIQFTCRYSSCADTVGISTDCMHIQIVWLLAHTDTGAQVVQVRCRYIVTCTNRGDLMNSDEIQECGYMCV